MALFLSGGLYLMVTILFVFGLLCLIKGGDWFVDSAVEIARISGLSQVLIGATIVSIAYNSS